MLKETEKKTKYVGCVTDDSYVKSLLRSSFEVKQLEMLRNKYSEKYEEGLNTIFSVGRLPRYYKN